MLIFSKRVLCFTADIDEHTKDLPNMHRLFRSARSVHAASQKPGAAVGTMIGALAPTEGRAVFPIGVLRVSSNMVAGAPMQVIFEERS